MSNKSIGATLKQRRKALGLTLDDVAAKVGVNATTVSRWESGEIENMRTNRIECLAKALQISPAVIMGWEDIEGNAMRPGGSRRKTIDRLLHAAEAAKEEHIRIATQLLQSLSEEDSNG